MPAVLAAAIESGTKFANGWSTAGSHSWPGGSRGLIIVASAGTPGPAISGHSASGGGVNWSELPTNGFQAFGGRRGLSVLISDGTPNSSAITVTATVTGGSTFQDARYLIVPIQGYDTGQIHDAAVRGENTGTAPPLNLPDAGTILAGDLLIAAFGFEDAGDGFGPAAGLTTHTLINGGTLNVRSLLVGTSTTDDTPGATWNTTGNGCGGIAFIVNTAAGGSVTGTFAVTEAADTMSASGTVATVGTFAVTEAVDTIAASGSAQSAVSGTLALTEGADTLAASGVAATQGTLSVTEADDTLAASGAAVTAITGTLSLTEAADTLAASGVAGTSGTLSVTEAADTLAASGSAQTAVTGSLARNEAGDSVVVIQPTPQGGAVGYEVGYGDASGPPYDTIIDIGDPGTYYLYLPSTGTWYINVRAYDAEGTRGLWGDEIVRVATEAIDQDTLAASGATGALGTFAATEAADTLAASGNAQTAVTGTLALTEGADTLAASGAAGAGGAFAVTEGPDTLAASGSAQTALTGTLAVTEGPDTLAASGAAAHHGSMAVTEGADTLAASGVAAAGVAGTFAATEGPDTLTAAGSALTAVSGTLAIAEAGDTLAASGAALSAIIGTLALTEGNDMLAASATVYGAQGPALASATVSDAAWARVVLSDIIGA